MKTFTNSEYLNLLKKISDTMYDEEEEIPLTQIDWSAEEAPIMKKMIEYKNQSVIDLLKADTKRIRDSITKHNNLQIGKLSIKITFHNETTLSLKDITFNITTYHEVNKTPSGAPAKLTVPLNICKDTRFEGSEWLKYFNKEHGKNIPLDTLVEIVRFFQVAHKLAAFM